MAFAHVQTKVQSPGGVSSASTANVTSFSETFTSTPAVGNLVVVFLTLGPNAGTPTVTDNQAVHNAWTVESSASTAGLSVAWIAWSILTTASGTFTVTASFAAAFASIGISEFSGNKASLPVDVKSTSTGTGTTRTGSTLTPTVAGDLFVSCGTDDGATNQVLTAPTGYSARSINGNDLTIQAIYSASIIDAASAAQQDTWTSDSSFAYAQVHVTFKAAAGAALTPLPGNPDPGYPPFRNPQNFDRSFTVRPPTLADTVIVPKSPIPSTTPERYTPSLEMRREYTAYSPGPISPLPSASPTQQPIGTQGRPDFYLFRERVSRAEYTSKAETPVGPQTVVVPKSPIPPVAPERAREPITEAWRDRSFVATALGPPAQVNPFAKGWESETPDQRIVPWQREMSATVTPVGPASQVSYFAKGYEPETPDQRLIPWQRDLGLSVTPAGPASQVGSFAKGWEAETPDWNPRLPPPMERTQAVNAPVQPPAVVLPIAPVQPERRLTPWEPERSAQATPVGPAAQVVVPATVASWLPQWIVRLFVPDGTNRSGHSSPVAPPPLTTAPTIGNVTAPERYREAWNPERTASTLPPASTAVVPPSPIPPVVPERRLAPWEPEKSASVLPVGQGAVVPPSPIPAVAPERRLAPWEPERSSSVVPVGQGAIVPPSPVPPVQPDQQPPPRWIDRSAVATAPVQPTPVPPLSWAGLMLDRYVRPWMPAPFFDLLWSTFTPAPPPVVASIALLGRDGSTAISGRQDSGALLGRGDSTSVKGTP